MTGAGALAAALAAADGPAVCAEVVAAARARGADHAQAIHGTGERFEIEFENRGVTQLRTGVDEGVSLIVFRDGRRGSASTNGRDPDAVAAALDEALAAAATGVADPANDVAAAPSQGFAAFGPDAADRDTMLDAVAACLAELATRYPKIRTRNSAYVFGTTESAFANSRGVVQHERRAAYNFGLAFIGKDGTATTSFNAAGAGSFTPFDVLLDAGCVRRLLDETLRSFDPRPIPEKFVGDIVVTPECLSGLIGGTLAGALSGPALMAGRTPYKERHGTAIAAPCLSVLNRPRAADFPGGASFDPYGVPTADLDVVKDGVLENFLVDFYYARKLGRAQTVGATNFVVPGGDRSIDDIVATTARGILLCRLSGGMPNADLEFSGVAKNSFLIEDGRIRGPLVETMIAANLQDVLKNIRALSRETVNFGNCRFPYLAASGVTISSKG
jgi:PmbA protein